MIEKIAGFMMKTDKRETIERLEQQNKESVRTLGKKRNFKYQGIIEAITIKQTEMKEKKEYL